MTLRNVLRKRMQNPGNFCWHMLSGINFMLFNCYLGRWKKIFKSVEPNDLCAYLMFLSYQPLWSCSTFLWKCTLIIINCSIKCWNLWPRVFKDEMQQTDTLCGQTGFSGTSCQDVTRGKEQGVPVTHREIFLGK